MRGDVFFKHHLYIEKYFAMGFLLRCVFLFLFGDNPSWKKTYPTVHGKFGSSHHSKVPKR